MSRGGEAGEMGPAVACAEGAVEQRIQRIPGISRDTGNVALSILSSCHCFTYYHYYLLLFMIFNN